MKYGALLLALAGGCAQSSLGVDLAGVDFATDDLADDAGGRDDLALAGDLGRDLAVPDLATPDLASPDLAVPDLATPDLATPDLALPDLSSADLTTPDLATPTYSVGGSISGVVGTVVLTNNGADDLPISMDGTFVFGARLPDLAAYLVAVKAQPLGQVCTVAAGSGNLASANVSTVSVTCRKAQVALNEIHARPAVAPYGDANGDGVRDASGDEFIELVSTESSVTLDLGGWSLKSGAGPTTTRFTFPAATALAPGARVVVFGGGTPTGSFGGAQTFVAGNLALTDAPAAYTVELAGGTVIVDSFAYDASVFGSSCTKACASVTRSPEGTGAFVAHTSVSGSAGILWSPGVAANQAIAKLSPPLSSPRGGATNVSVLAFLTMQFNMFMTAGDLGAVNLTLFASSCAAAANPVNMFTTLGPGADASQALLIPTAPLGYGATYCLRAGGVRSAAGVVFDGSVVDYEWSTRPAASVRAGSVVVSEFGGASLAGGAGGNDEFVELYNASAAVVDVSGWFVQRRSAGGTATCYATLPAATTLQPGQFYLIGGAGYTAASYGGVTVDSATASTAITGGSESIVLISSAGTCTGSSSVVDAVTVQVSGAAITDTMASLQLPPLSAATGNGKSVERKACYDSTGDAAVATGMFAGGGHATKGNGEKIAAGNADWILRTTPNPQNSTSTEAYGCP